MDDLDLPGEVRGRLPEYADGRFVARRRAASATCSAKAAMRALSKGR